VAFCVEAWLDAASAVAGAGGALPTTLFPGFGEAEMTFAVSANAAGCRVVTGGIGVADR
jgi:hypothetical protein